MTDPAPAPDAAAPHSPSRPEIMLVVARAANGAIGRDGGLPWHLPDDLRRFKRLTSGAPMLMGRRTFESLPGLLPGRRHIVLTRDAAWRATGAEPAGDVAAALALAGGTALSVIGGAEIFRLLEPRAARVELTEVHAAIPGDVSIPPFAGDRWQEIAREEHAAADGRPGFAFVTLVRAG